MPSRRAASAASAGEEAFPGKAVAVETHLHEIKHIRRDYETILKETRQWAHDVLAAKFAKPENCRMLWVPVATMCKPEMFFNMPLKIQVDCSSHGYSEYAAGLKPRDALPCP